MPSVPIPEMVVKLSGLKQFALEKLPEGALRDDILSQPDEISTQDYLANCRIWLRLTKLGSGRRSGH
jgi:hypothetical protein